MSSQTFDIEVFLSGVLKGAPATRQRHIRQAKVIQKAIQARWQLDNPWRWQEKHVLWFWRCWLKGHAVTSRYYYGLTLRLIVVRLGKAEHWRWIGKSLRK